MKTKYFFLSIALISFLFGCNNENNNGIIPDDKNKGAEGTQSIYFTWTVTDESRIEASFELATSSATNDILVDWGDGSGSLPYSGTNGLSPDGTTNENLVPRHTYTSTGTYNVKVTAKKPHVFSGSFYIDNRNLSSLDVSECVDLRILYCHSNQLTQLDLSNNTNLRWLSCSSNQLTQLDLSNNTNLWSLDCSNNKLTHLDLSNNKELGTLDYSNNQITHSDLSNNKELSHLYCADNQLTQLDLSNNEMLHTFSCSYNQLTHLDLSNNKELRYFYCESMQLTHLDLSNNKKLMALECSNNQLTQLDLSDSKNLFHLHCSSNQLTHLDLSNNKELETLHCHSNQLTSLDLSSNKRLLWRLECYNNSIPFIDMFSASEIIKDSEFGYNRAGTQTLETVTWHEDTAVIDSVFWGNGTSFDVTLDGKAAITNEDYSITDGTISFFNKGLYSITISNPMIVSDPEFPAKVIANFNIPDLQ